VAQDQVVGVLNAQPGGAAKEIEGIKQLLEIEKGDVPGIILRRESAAQRSGGIAVAASGMVKNDG
jgi:hypothetical protein